MGVLVVAFSDGPFRKQTMPISAEGAKCVGCPEATEEELLDSSTTC